MKKKILSLAIAICMVATLLPSVVLAAGAEDTTTTASLTGTDYRLLYTFNTNVDGYTDGTAHTDENPIDNAIGFEDTKGMWSGFAEADSNFQPQIKGGGLYIPTKKNTTWYALKIRVPITNYYTVTFVKYEQKNTNTTYGVGDVYFLKETDAYKTLDNTNIADALETGDKLFESVNYVGSTTSTAYASGGTKYNQYLEAGEYIVIFNATKPNATATEGAEDAYRQSPAYIVLSTANAANTKATLTKDTKIYTGTVTLDKVELEIGGEQAHATAAVYSVADGYTGVKSFAHNKTPVTTGITFKSSKESVATVDSDGNITAVGPGTTEITAMLTDGTYGSTIPATLTVKAAEPDEDQALTNAFDAEIDKNVPYDAPTVTGVTVSGGVIKASDSGDGTFTLTADEEDENGNKFLYWAKGKTLGKKIISFLNELTNYMPEANDKNHILIAVYEGDVPEKEEWYNANGQRIATGTAPETYPSMAGYGTAEGWDDYTDKIHVARYARQTPTAGINVTVEGENTSGGGTNLTYGDEVTCTATGENFKCWTKSDINGNTEIVSTDKVYEFRAWETCTVEAIYQDDYTYKGNTMKIILDVFDVGNEKAVMAEFIGFGNSAVEKGIIWNGTKIAMTKPGTQFTLTGNVGDTFEGYAIVDNDNETYNEITDGSVTINE